MWRRLRRFLAEVYSCFHYYFLSFIPCLIGVFLFYPSCPFHRITTIPNFSLPWYILFACITPHDTKFLQTHRIFIACNKNPPFSMECFYSYTKNSRNSQGFFKHHLQIPSFPQDFYNILVKIHPFLRILYPKFPNFPWILV